MIVGGVVWGNFLFSRSVCMSVDSAGISRVLIKYSGKYVEIYFNMKITYFIKRILDDFPIYCTATNCIVGLIKF